MVDLPLLQFVAVMQAFHASRTRNVVIVKAQPILLIFFILRLSVKGLGLHLITAEMILKHRNGVKNSK